MTKWHEIHDFVRGWGFQEEDTRTCVELPSKSPFRVSKILDDGPVLRTLFAGAVRRHLSLDLFSVPEAELDALYDRLQAVLDALPPPAPVEFNLDRITIPKTTKPWPQMDLQKIMDVQPMRDEL